MKRILLIILICSDCTLLFSQDSVRFGALLMTNAEYNKLPKIKRSKIMSRIPIPDNFYVETPPPGNQLGMGSCVSWAVDYTFFSSLIRKAAPPSPIPSHLPPHMVWDETTEFSPSYVFNQIVRDHNDCVLYRPLITWTVSTVDMAFFFTRQTKILRN